MGSESDVCVGGKMWRGRSREREREREPRRRSRSYSRERWRREDERYRPRREERGRWETRRIDRPPPPPPNEPTPSKDVLELQKKQQDAALKQRQAYRVMMQAQILTGMRPPETAGKKQRELYVGNLTIGLVTSKLLQELFDGALHMLVPDPEHYPPTVIAQVDPMGKYAFVEMRTEDLATMALELDKLELCGRRLIVGRPKGYVEPLPPPPGTPSAMETLRQVLQYVTGTVPTAHEELLKVLLLQNMVPQEMLHEEGNRKKVAELVEEECARKGKVESVVVPEPRDGESSKVYVAFEEHEQAKLAVKAFDKRTFNDREIAAQLVLQSEMEKACEGTWNGLGKVVEALGAEVETWIKVRGLPYSANKKDLVEFFEDSSISEDNVRIVMGQDGRPSGEAFCFLRGPESKLRTALSRNRNMLGSRFVEVFSTTAADVEQQEAMGKQLA